MAKQDRKKRVAALVLAGLMAGTCWLPVSADSIDDGVASTYDEAYYATLDYYGNLLEGSVVKSYALNGVNQVTDYGAYDQVVNLTDATPGTTDAGCTTFQFSQAPSHFYFEGKTSQPFQDLPWTITLRYTLNGVPAKAEDLAGKTGVVEILLDIVPNEHASDYARYNYTLEAMALFNEDDILSLEAEGAQVQLVGNLRTVLFMCLPGEEQHFTIRVGSNDFSFSGLTILMVPATLAQLEEIAKLSQRKDDLEEDYRNLSGSLDALLDAMYEIQDGLYASAKGLDQLDVARGTISAGKGQLYDDAGVLRGDLSNIADLLEPVEQRTLLLSQTITSSKTVLGAMTDTAVSLQDQLIELEEALDGMEEGAGDVRRVIRTLADMKSSLRSLQRALGSTSISTGSSNGSRNDLKQQVDKVKAVGSAYEEDDQTAFFEKMLTLNGDQNAKETAASMSGALELYDKTLEEETAKYLGNTDPDSPEAEAIRKAVKESVDKQFEAQPGWKETQQMDALHTAKDKLSFQQFAGQLPGVDSQTAKTMSDLWTVYNSGKLDKTSAQAQPEEQAEPEALGIAEPGPGEDPGPMARMARSVPEPDGGSAAGSSDPGSSSAGSESAGSGESNTVGGAAVDLIVNGLDKANERINEIQGDLNRSLNRITRPTGVVVGELAGLCDQVEELIDLVDSAEDAAAALRESSGKIRNILAEVNVLRNILNEYEPTLQEGVANVGSLSTSATAALRDLETMLADTESLAQTSGNQLDAGTRQSLRGLASTLRQTAKAMEATGDVKQAKLTINDIIEDTWHEYTGDINNILLMDAEAEAVSLTDSRNPAPSSVQVLIRTQEIKTEEPEQDAEQTAAKAETTFWGRVAQMFKDFWNAITGIFH